MSGRLNLLDTMEQTMYKFSNGNPGALQTLFELLKANQENFFSNLLTIDRMEIYEDKLYMCYGMTVVIEI